jgi:hypothetical protein
LWLKNPASSWARSWEEGTTETQRHREDKEGRSGRVYECHFFPGASARSALLYAPDAVAELEEAFRNDLKTAIRLERHVFARRPFGGRLLDNACRLVSPVL